jgi:hypothetical protein
VLLAPRSPNSKSRGVLAVCSSGSIAFRLAVDADNAALRRWHGKRVLSYAVPSKDGNTASLHVVSKDNGDQILASNADMHEFLLTDRTLIHIDVSLNASGSVVENGFTELDPSHPERRPLLTWKASTHFPARETYASVLDNGDGWHLNSIDVDPRDGHLLVSARNAYSIWKVHRSEGRVLWKLGGKGSYFKMLEGAEFAYQHDVRVEKAAGKELRLRMLDSGFDGTVKTRNSSRVLWLALDESKKEVRVAREISHPDNLLSSSAGTAQLLENGGVFVNWGQTGRLSEFDSRGELVWDAQLPAGEFSYHAEKVGWTELASAVRGIEGAEFFPGFPVLSDASTSASSGGFGSRGLWMLGGAAVAFFWARRRLKARTTGGLPIVRSE